MNSQLDDIKESIVPLLRSRGVRKAALFGSFARGEARMDSDLDILIDIGEEHSLLDIVGLRLDLEERLVSRLRNHDDIAGPPTLIPQGGKPPSSPFRKGGKRGFGHAAMTVNRTFGT